jgi:cytochrome c oxidase assembly protein subunit 11
MRRSRAKAATALLSVGVIAGMLGLTAAAVPLYDWFCRVTGYGGTPQVVERASADVGERTVRVRFNADIDPHLPWRFTPMQREVEVRLGEQSLAFYRAENRSDRPVVGSATFNVTPHKAGLYFSKLACFCFEEQVLQPGEAVEMPVSFYVDPELVEDAATSDVGTITLSYTFFLRKEATDALAEAGGGPSS